MTVKPMNPAPRFVTFVSRALLLLFLATSLSAATALAQDDQAYKKAYNAGLAAYKAKNITEARAQWVKAADLARQAGDKDIAKKSNYYVAQLDYKLGLGAYKKDQFEQAIKHFKEGTARYPEYVKNLYGEGLALKKLNRTDEALAKFQETIAAGDKYRDRETAGEAKERIREHFYYLASSAVSKQNASKSDADRALGALTSSKEYLEPDADYYYYTAVAYNIKGDYGQSVSMADQALGLHRGSKTDKAKIYFVKGEALMYAGDTAGAKAAFQNAAYGSYAASARHYLDTL